MAPIASKVAKFAYDCHKRDFLAKEYGVEVIKGIKPSTGTLVWKYRYGQNWYKALHGDEEKGHSVWNAVRVDYHDIDEKFEDYFEIVKDPAIIVNKFSK